MKRTSDPTRPPRRGVSLIELLVVLTVLAVILSTSTVTLYRLLHAQTAGTTALSESMSTARLARDLRRDAHAAAAAALATAGDETTLTLSGAPAGKVRYIVSDHGLRREAQTTDGTSLREDYRLGAVTVQMELTEQNRLITLRLQRNPISPAESPNLDAPLPHTRRPLTTIQAALRPSPLTPNP